MLPVLAIERIKKFIERSCEKREAFEYLFLRQRALTRRKRPGKHLVGLRANGAGAAQAADWAARGALVAPAWNLAKAAGVRSATFLFVALGRRAKSQIR